MGDRAYPTSVDSVPARSPSGRYPRRFVATVVNGGRALLVVAALVAAMDLAAAQEPAPLGDLPVGFGGPFSLVDHRGKKRTDKDYRGRFMLIYFGYTSGPDHTPGSLREMTDALDRLGDKAGQVQPLLISIDPSRDTRRDMRDYVGLFHPSLVGLTGSAAQIARAVRAYKIHAKRVPVHDPEHGDDYLIEHSSMTFLMGPEGEFVTLFPHDTPAATMAAAIERYLE